MTPEERINEEDSRDLIGLIAAFSASQNPHLRANAAQALALLANESDEPGPAEAQLIKTLLLEQISTERDWSRPFRAGILRALDTLKADRLERVVEAVRSKLSDVSDPTRHSALFEALLRHFAGERRAGLLSRRELLRLAGGAGRSTFLGLVWEAGWRFFIIALLTTFVAGAAAGAATNEVLPETAFMAIIYYAGPVGLLLGLTIRYSIGGNPELSWQHRLMEAGPTAVAGAVLALLWALLLETGGPSLIQALSAATTGFAAALAARLIRWLPMGRGLKSKVPALLELVMLGALVSLAICYLAALVDPPFAAHLIVFIVPLGMTIAWLNIWLEKRRPELLGDRERERWTSTVTAGAVLAGAAMLFLPLLAEGTLVPIDVSEGNETVSIGNYHRLVGAKPGRTYRTIISMANPTAVITAEFKPPNAEVELLTNSQPDTMMEEDALIPADTPTDTDATNLAEPLTSVESMESQASPNNQIVEVTNPMAAPELEATTDTGIGLPPIERDGKIPDGTKLCVSTDMVSCGAGGSLIERIANYLFWWTSSASPMRERAQIEFELVRPVNADRPTRKPPPAAP